MTEEPRAPASRQDDASALPRNTTPTWEVELLISGVAVFAMLQLPGWLDDAMFALSPRFGNDWYQLLLLLYFYGKSAAVVLAATFVVHLVLRARWIALVGMYSVYPDGVRLERLRMGALQREIERRKHADTAATVDRADNAATIVFAVGVMIAIMFVIIATAVCTTFVATIMANGLFGLRLEPLFVMMAAFAMVMIPYAVAMQADRLDLPPLREGRPLRRHAERLLRGYARVGLSPANNRIMALLASHGGERRMFLLTITIMTGAIIGVIAGYNAMQDPARFGSYVLFPDPGAEGQALLEPAHYADQRDALRETEPFIQSQVISGSFLQLQVPYEPRRDDPALRKGCAAIHAADDSARASGTLACLHGLHAVSLDGKPLQTLHYELASDARSERPALLAMIDVRKLAPGRHELRIARPPAAGDDDADAKDIVVRIPFWR